MFSPAPPRRATNGDRLMADPVKTLKLELTIPPSVNHAYATVRGRRVLSLEGRRYKAAAEGMATIRAHEQRFQCPPTARLALALRLYFPNNRRRDISNCVKLVEDALASALGFDDCRVDRLLVERAAPDQSGARCEVRLEVL